MNLSFDKGRQRFIWLNGSLEECRHNSVLGVNDTVHCLVCEPSGQSWIDTTGTPMKTAYLWHSCSQRGAWSYHTYETPTNHPGPEEFRVPNGVPSTESACSLK